MLSYTVYSEAGGVGKTTLTANLAVAHARAGLDVLVIPLDPQDGDLSRLLDIDQHRADSSQDNIVRHLVDRASGEFRELIREDVDHPGVDVIPEHNMLEDLADALRNEREARSGLGESFPIYTQLFRVLKENTVHEDYDVLIVDPPATSGPHLYNAIHATRNLVLPIEPSSKGEASVQGLEDLVENMEAKLDIDVGVLAAVPNGFGNTTDQRETIEDLEALGYDIPAVIGERKSMLEGCWKQQCSAFTYVREHRDRKRDHELETLAQFDEIARHIEQVGGVEAPSPPEPGSLDVRMGVTE